jgi:hypothetical protein
MRGRRVSMNDVSRKIGAEGRADQAGMGVKRCEDSAVRDALNAR